MSAELPFRETIEWDQSIGFSRKVTLYDLDALREMKPRNVQLVRSSGLMIAMPSGMDFQQRDTFCAYCRSKVQGLRCDSCGAPVSQ